MRRRAGMMPFFGKMALLGLGVGAYTMYNKNNKNQGNNTNNQNNNQNNNQ